METTTTSWREKYCCSINRACVFGVFTGLILGLCIFYGAEYHIFRRHQALPSTTKIHQSVELQPASRKLPGAIIIGVKKGGTRALLNMLKIHPSIQTVSGEPHFFDKNSTYEKGLQWYKERMPITGRGILTMEKTPAYFVVPTVPKRVFEFHKSIKLVLIVRDPVERTISDYTQLNAKKKRFGKSKKPSFAEAVFDSVGNVREKASIVRVSLYDVHYVRWLRYFDKSQIHVVNGDKFIKDPFSELKKVEEFLEVKPFYKESMFVFNEEKGFYCWKKKSKSSAAKKDASTACLGPSKGRKHPSIDKELIEKLRDFYKPHMKRFCSITGIDFDWF